MADPAESSSATTKGDATRQRLTAIAVHRFGASGYRPTSIAAITREAGVTAAAAYPYFPTKQSLFLAALCSEIDILLHGAIDAGARSAQPWLDTLRHLEDHVEDHPLIVRALDGEPPELAIDLFELEPVRAFLDHHREQIALAQRTGQARGDIDPATMALGIETLTLATLSSVARRAMRDHPDRRHAVAAVLLTALLPPADEPARATKRRSSPGSRHRGRTT